MASFLFQKRDIFWTEAAKKDLLWQRITRDEWRVIKAEVQRLAGKERLDLDTAVCTVAQTGHEWLRLKIREPQQIRVFFSLEAGSPPRLIVQAVLRRSGRTYDLAEIIFKTRQGA